jgi:hypothetical protein
VIIIGNINLLLVVEHGVHFEVFLEIHCRLIIKIKRKIIIIK